jgi:hypothetical protein
LCKYAAAGMSEGTNKHGAATASAPPVYFRQRNPFLASLVPYDDAYIQYHFCCASFRVVNLNQIL